MRTLLSLLTLAALLTPALALADDATPAPSATATPAPGGKHKGWPSQAAIDACSGKAETDACTFDTPKRGTITGACKNTPKNGMVCIGPGGKGGKGGKPAPGASATPAATPAAQ